jgi:hypothetical protein
MTLKELYIAEKTMTRRVEETVRQADVFRHARLARKMHPGWLARASGHVLSWLSRWLVTLGGRLVYYGLPGPTLRRADQRLQRAR